MYFLFNQQQSKQLSPYLQTSNPHWYLDSLAASVCRLSKSTHELYCSAPSLRVHWNFNKIAKLIFRWLNFNLLLCLVKSYNHLTRTTGNFKRTHEVGGLNYKKDFSGHVKMPWWAWKHCPLWNITFANMNLFPKEALFWLTTNLYIFNLRTNILGMVTEVSKLVVFTFPLKPREKGI